MILHEVHNCIKLIRPRNLYWSRMEFFVWSRTLVWGERHTSLVPSEAALTAVLGTATRGQGSARVTRCAARARHARRSGCESRGAAVYGIGSTFGHEGAFWPQKRNQDKDFLCCPAAFSQLVPKQHTFCFQPNLISFWWQSNSETLPCSAIHESLMLNCTSKD